MSQRPIQRAASLRQFSQQKDLTLPGKKTRRLILYIIPVLLAACPLQSSEKASRNEVTGVVVDGDSDGASPLYVSGAMAVALRQDNVEISRTDEPTSSTGRFRFVVPESNHQFRLMVYDKNHRYWIYRPQESITNKIHPHDIGKIQLYSLSARNLSDDELHRQFNSARVLNSIDPVSSNFFLSKLVSEYTAKIPTGCPAGPVPTSIKISNLPTLLPASAIQDVYPEPLPQKLSLPTVVPPELKSQVAKNESKVVSAMQHVDDLESAYHKRAHSYGSLSQLNSRDEDFLVAGYCIDLVVGTLSDGVFKGFQPEKGPFNYYLQVANPLIWNVTGETYLYSDPSRIIRLSKSRKPLESLDEAKPMPKDFPEALQEGPTRP